MSEAETATQPSDAEIASRFSPASVAGWIDAHPTTMRWILAGPVALILAIVSMSAMPFWFPEGAAGVDHLAMPVILFPLIWTATLMYPCLDDKLARATLIMLGATLLQLLVIILSF